MGTAPRWPGGFDAWGYVFLCTNNNGAYPTLGYGYAKGTKGILEYHYKQFIDWVMGEAGDVHFHGVTLRRSTDNNYEFYASSEVYLATNSEWKKIAPGELILKWYRSNSQQGTIIRVKSE